MLDFLEMVVLLSISTIIQFTEVLESTAGTFSLNGWLWKRRFFQEQGDYELSTVASHTYGGRDQGCEWITVHAVYGLYQQISWPKRLTVTANRSQIVSMWKAFQDWSQNWNLYGVATRVWTELLIVVLGHHSCGTDNHPLHPNQVLA